MKSIRKSITYVVSSHIVSVDVQTALNLDFIKVKGDANNVYGTLKNISSEEVLVATIISLTV